MLVAELVSFQNLLKRRPDNKDNSDDNDETPISPRGVATPNGLFNLFWTTSPSAIIHHWSRGSVLFFFSCIAVVSAWTIAELFGFLHGENHGSILLSLASVFVNIILFIMIMGFLARGATGSKKLNEEDLDRQPKESFIQNAVLHLLGASGGGSRADYEKKRKELKANDWRGRVYHLQQEMTRIAKEQSDLTSLSESRLRTEINELHGSINSLKEVITMEETQKESSKGYEI